MAKYSEQVLTSKVMESIKCKLQACLFMICEITLSLGDDGVWVIPYDKPLALSDMENTILSHIKKLEDNLALRPGEREEKLSEISRIGQDIRLIAESIYGYYATIMELQEIIVHFQRLALVKKEGDVGLDIHGFYHDCIDFVEAGDVQGQKDKIAMLMKALPMKMAREKYYEYICRGVDNLVADANEGFVEDVIKSLKFKFMACKMDNYGQYYPELKDKLDTIFALDFEQLSMAELTELYQDLDETQVVFEDIMDYIATLYECVNFLILILTFAKDMEYLLEEDMAYMDIFHTAAENIFSPEAELFSENLRAMLDQVNEDLVDKIIGFEKDEGLDASEISQESLSEETWGILDIDGIITRGYYETLRDVIYPLRLWKEGEPANQSFLEDKKEELTTFIKSALEGLKPSLQRIVKRLFLDGFPSPFSKEEFGDYLNYILETTNDFSQKLAMLDSVGAVFEMTGFADTLKQSGAQDHGHHHH